MLFAFALLPVFTKYTQNKISFTLPSRQPTSQNSFCPSLCFYNRFLHSPANLLSMALTKGK